MTCHVPDHLSCTARSPATGKRLGTLGWARADVCASPANTGRQNSPPPMTMQSRGDHAKLDRADRPKDLSPGHWDSDRRSQAWATLSLATRRQRENIFRKLGASHGVSKLSAWRRGDVVAGRDKRADRPAAARHFVEALRGFFEWAVEANLLRVDPTAGVKVVKAKTEGFAIWTDDDIAVFRSRWPLGTRERLAFEVIFATGLRRGDAARLGRQHVSERRDPHPSGDEPTPRSRSRCCPSSSGSSTASRTGNLTFIATQPRERRW